MRVGEPVVHGSGIHPASASRELPANVLETWRRGLSSSSGRANGPDGLAAIDEIAPLARNRGEITVGRCWRDERVRDIMLKHRRWNTPIRWVPLPHLSGRPDVFDLGLAASVAVDFRIGEREPLLEQTGTCLSVKVRVVDALRHDPGQSLVRSDV